MSENGVRITNEEWVERGRDIADVSSVIFTYSHEPLTGDEHRNYAKFIQTAMDLVDEEHPPPYLIQSREENRQAIQHILTKNINSFRLRRMLPLLQPETSLRLADTIARLGTDKMYWK